MNETFAGFGGTPLALHRVGSGRPVILLHGLFSSAEMNWLKFGHAATIAAQGYEVLMPDLRAHGASAAPHDPAAYPPDVLVRDLAALVEHLALTDYDLGGFSLGARTVLHAVAKGVVEPRRLVVAGMGVAGLDDWSRRAAFFIRVIDEFDTLPHGDPGWLAAQFLKSQKVDRVAARLLLGSISDLPPGLLASVDMPALVVCGDQDDDNGSSVELAKRLPDAVHVEVPGTHMGSVARKELGIAIAGWLGPASRLEALASGETGAHGR
ncbi:MAG: alpha/beta fold hydrolase [Altererythrobacter sp.]|nr:alpha/beta fold hydrolase [Altererythrobacter sp.]